MKNEIEGLGLAWAERDGLVLGAESLLPGLNRIRSGRNAFQRERAGCWRDGKIGVCEHEHIGAHPRMDVTGNRDCELRLREIGLDRRVADRLCFFPPALTPR